MRRKHNIIPPFLIMLCLGSIYAWSIFVPELKDGYNLTTAQTQIIFGTVISVFTLTMIWATRLIQKLGSRFVATVSGLLYFSGYLVAFLSEGNFFILWLGIGILGGVGTGMGYLVSLTVPIKWFPDNKGFVTGIVVAGFGAGAILLTYMVDFLLKNSVGVLHIFLYSGIFYGLIITIAAQKIKVPNPKGSNLNNSTLNSINGIVLFNLILGIFAGTFTGLLIIGNLKPIAQLQKVSFYVIPLAISLFALSNFTGRIVWGWMSDRFSNIFLIPISLMVQGAASIGLFLLPNSDIQFISLIVLIGFCFGAHFVLFAKDTIQKFGIENYGKIYPFIFLGYGFAGIAGPLIGGWVVDLTGQYVYAMFLAFTLSIIATFIYLLIERRLGLKKKQYKYIIGN